MVTDQTGKVIARHDYLPFGEEIPGGIAQRPSPFGGSDDISQRFTGKERDSESGLDYFGARYYGSALGRFTSPDPAWFFASHPEDPQSWNLYSYVANDPLNSVDIDGNDCVHLNSAGTDVQRDKNGNPTGIDQHTDQGHCEGGGGYWVNGTVTRITLYTNSKDVGLDGRLDDGTLTSSHYTSVSDTSSDVPL